MNVQNFIHWAYVNVWQKDIFNGITYYNYFYVYIVVFILEQISPNLFVILHMFALERIEYTLCWFC